MTKKRISFRARGKPVSFMAKTVPVKGYTRGRSPGDTFIIRRKGRKITFQVKESGGTKIIANEKA